MCHRGFHVARSLRERVPTRSASRPRYFLRPFIVLVGLAVLAGCEDGKPKGDLPPLHPVTGKVVRGGQPVSGGLIQFFADPADPDLVINAEVGPDGSFELQTLHSVSQKKAKGAPAGSYKVNYTPPQGDQAQGGAVGGMVALSERQTVKDGPNELTVELGKK
jgi:hypothetical protein